MYYFGSRACITSGEFQDLLEKNEIKHINIATGSPQANGQVKGLTEA